MGEDSTEPDLDDKLKDWRQGDFSLGVGGFIFGQVPDEGSDEILEVGEEDILGLIAISQTCDIVRRTGGRHFVTMCPLISIDDETLKAINNGRRPYFAALENSKPNHVADLRRIMSVNKDLVRTWNRIEGFSTDAGRVKFAKALERKFGQFAFPDEFDDSMSLLKERVWKRHEKSDSPVGKIYRSLHQIRYLAEPNWTASEKSITVIAIMHDEDKLEATRNDISSELQETLNKIRLPDGYEFSETRFILATAADLTGEDIFASQLADFEFLC